MDPETTEENMVNSNSEDGGGGIQARFTHFCKNGLSMDENCLAQATELLGKIASLFSADSSSISSIVPEEAEKYWFAFVVYTVRKLGEEETHFNGFSLCQILRVANLNVVDFLKEIPQFVVKVGPSLSKIYGEDWEKKFGAKELQANFVNLSNLSKYYKRAYREFFKVSLDEKLEYHRFGWLLFLALRIHVFRFKDIVSCTNGLVSILATLIIHVPIGLRNFDINDSKRFVKKGNKVDLIASLCSIYETSEDDLRDTLEKTNNLIKDLLKGCPCLASESSSENLDNFDPDGIIYFKGLMEAPSLSSSLSILEKDYDDAMQKNGDLDERIFVDEGDNLLSGAVSINRDKRKFECITSPIKTMTSPVSNAMTSAKWLRTIISSLPSKPSIELESFLSSCDRDISAQVIRRAHIILEAIFPSPNSWPQSRRLEALQLYYRVLLAICKAESQILNTKNLTLLLTNERFQRCMLACSAELVLATHKTVTMLFPAVLEKTGITAFDLSKVIESFIRHEESLPRELRRHLNSLEERLLESMVWEKGSSMYNSLSIAKPLLSSEINRCGLLAESMPSLDAIAIQGSPSRSPKRACTEFRSVLVERNSFTSPVKDRNRLLLKNSSPVLHSAFASPARPNPGGEGETCAETSINVFFAKIMKLGAVRINGMIERLKLPHETRENIYLLFQKILTQRTTLFFNHHIDQIILCSLYGVAKISQLKPTFKDIIYNYRKQPHCKEQVFRSVYIEGSGSHPIHVDIITFYNQVFIPNVKPLMMEVFSLGTCDNKIQDKHGTTSVLLSSPKPSSFPSLPDMSPKKVCGSHNVYVSPLRQSKMDALITHTSKSYYACVGESTHAYQSPSKDLTTINNHLNGSKKLNFDDFGLVSHSLVNNTLQNGTFFNH